MTSTQKAPMPSGRCAKSHSRPYRWAVLDAGLSALGSLAAVLLMRCVSEPVPGFAGLVILWLGAGVAWTILALLVFGRGKKWHRFASSRSRAQLLRIMAVKGVGMALLGFSGAAEALSGVQMLILVLADLLFSAATLFLPRALVKAVWREERTILASAGQPNALVAGTGRASVAYAREIESAGKYNVVGFLTRDPARNGMVIGEHVAFYAGSTSDIDALQWRLGGIDTIFFPGGYPRRETSARN
jgi:Predicted nucleoside-diphosphate sugar epimerases